MDVSNSAAVTPTTATIAGASGRVKFGAWKQLRKLLCARGRAGTVSDNVAVPKAQSTATGFFVRRPSPRPISEALGKTPVPSLWNDLFGQQGVGVPGTRSSTSVLPSSATSYTLTTVTSMSISASSSVNSLSSISSTLTSTSENSSDVAADKADIPRVSSIRLQMSSSLRKLAVMFQKILTKSQKSPQRNLESDGATGFFLRMPSKESWEDNQLSLSASLKDDATANAVNASGPSKESIEPHSDPSLELALTNEFIEQPSDPSLENDTVELSNEPLEQQSGPSLENDTLELSNESIEQQSGPSHENDTLELSNESIEQQSDKNILEDAFLQDEREDVMSPVNVAFESGLIRHCKSISPVRYPDRMALYQSISSLSTISFTTASLVSLECSQDRTSIPDDFSFSNDSRSLSFFTDSSESDYDSSWYSSSSYDSTENSSTSQELAFNLDSSTDQDLVTSQNKSAGQCASATSQDPLSQ